MLELLELLREVKEARRLGIEDAGALDWVLKKGEEIVDKTMRSIVAEMMERKRKEKENVPAPF